MLTPMMGLRASLLRLGRSVRHRKDKGRTYAGTRKKGTGNIPKYTAPGLLHSKRGSWAAPAEPPGGQFRALAILGPEAQEKVAVT